MTESLVTVSALPSMGGQWLGTAGSRQGCTAASITEAEYVTAHLASQVLVWMHQLMLDLRYPQFAATMLHSNNQATIRLVHNLEFHKHIKHMGVKYHVIRSHFYEQRLVVPYTLTSVR